jgi:hypothetical protein
MQQRTRTETMTKRGRAPGFTMSVEHRVKIQNSNVLNALIEHAEGKREMSASQVSAGLGLLKKVMPDLSATTISGTLDDKRAVTDWTKAELVGLLHDASQKEVRH